MKLLPTLNIQNGHVVPMIGPAAETWDPFALAGELLDLGCHHLALVDVDAARGHGHNRELLARLLRTVHAGRNRLCIQVGGGIRSSDQAQFFLDHGATWLSVGTILLRSPLMADQLLARFRDHLTAAVDARRGDIQASGWGESARMGADSAAARIRELGFRRILFMDIPAVEGPVRPDFATARALCRDCHIPLFMGGSLRTREHLAEAREVPGLHGVAVDGLLLRSDPDLAAALAPPCV